MKVLFLNGFMHAFQDILLPRCMLPTYCIKCLFFLGLQWVAMGKAFKLLTAQG